MFKRSTLIVLSLIGLSGCASTGSPLQPATGELPAAWAAEGRAESGIDKAWWKLYGDPQLDRLVDEALAQNSNLALAVARVDEARAQLGMTRSNEWPSVDANFTRSRQQSSESSSMPLPPGTPRERNDYRATLNVAYELDLWGRLRHTTAAARADLLANEAARETVRITLAADVVQGYFALRAFDEQIAATQRALATRSEWLGLQKLRFEEGVISEFDFRQLEADVAAAHAQLPSLALQRGQQENALAVLLGRSPKAIYEGAVGRHPEEAGSVPLALVAPAGLPSELLLRRPDLIEAEQRLIAANARIAAARTALFPSISLTGYLGSESAVLRNLFSGPAGIWSLAAAIAQPIFAGGKLKAGIDAAEARERQALIQYQQAIQTAFKEVRNAILAQVKMRERFEAEERRVVALRQSLHLAKLRYENGVASQLDVLDSERNLLNAEQNRADAQRAQRAAIADLFKALGGGWKS
ncbi:MAG: efflux transporter outer membrane subunit [Burkholderiales bacterium]|nr:efflux transporter outer membrane subunit [Burkholderiales bacterium]